MSERISLFTATDSAYLLHVRALLASFRHFHPEGKCLVYPVGLSDIHRRELVNYGATLVAPDNEPAHCSSVIASCWRFCALLRHVSACDDGVVIVTDADAIVRSRLDSISAALTGADVALRLRRGRDPNRRIYAGLLGVRSTSGARLFLESYERLLKQDDPTWYADQRNLFKAYLELKRTDRATFANLSDFAMERARRLDDDAPIWFPNGAMRRSRKFKSASAYWQNRFTAAI